MQGSIFANIDFSNFSSFISKSSSAAVRIRRRLGNTSTCPYVRFDI